MLDGGEQLIDVLRRRLGPKQAGLALSEAGTDMGLPEGDHTSPVCVAYSLLKLDFQPDEVSRLLSWQGFERLAGALIRASGYEVRNNVVLTRPKAQIDVVAYGASMVLCVDCKHYRREQGPSALRMVAQAQLRRSALLKEKSGDPRPVASVILSMSEPEGKFVEGVAVVPVRSLRSFLTSLDSYTGLLELR